MALYKIADFNPNYRQDAFNGDDIKGYDVYAGQRDEKIGSVYDLLVDEAGRFRYVVVDTGFWIFGKKVLVPVAQCRVDSSARRIYATALTSKDQVERLPEYDDNMTVDYDYEERVRGVYRTPTVEASAPVEATPPVEAAGTKAVTTPGTPARPVADRTRATTYDRTNYSYDREPQLFNMNERDHKTFRLYEERLVADKQRRKAGEVEIGKRVETETARAAVPVEKERVVVERTTPANAGTPVTPGNADFREGEVARIEVYEETADIKKQAFVREEVNVRKEVERDTVEATETLRREELDVNTEGKPVIDRRDPRRTDR